MFKNVIILISVILLFVLGACSAINVNCSNKDEVDKYMKGLIQDHSTLFSQYAHITKTENLAQKFQEVEDFQDTSLKIEDILPVNSSLYLKRRPPTVCGRPAYVIYHVMVLSLDSINEAAMTYSLDIYLTISWIDHRLRFPDTLRAYRILDPAWLGSVWQPDTVFKNAREVTFHEKIVPNHYLWMLPNKALVYVTKLTLILTCSMDFQAYPHDTQECGLEIESMTYNAKEIVFKWDANSSLHFKTKDGKIQTPQFKSVHNKTEECTVPYLTGTYSCIRLVFYLRRRLGYHLIHTYVPSGFVVVLSWITFWIKPRDVAARIGLGVTSLLTLTTLNSQSQETLPPVSYGKAIDIWMSCCALFVFCSILEFAVINYLVCRFPENEENLNPVLQKPKTIKGHVSEYFDRRKIQIIAHNIDRLSRFFFPACFLCLNIWYWRTYLQEDHINGVEVEDNDLNEV
ncbi:glycine receptor subunit alphaZ1-like isoform X2 [Planococcus citri]|uniref:glycine receptor subunit alphaZ1-like isoform X2 n=1 Tax=Planococcus citri TaxID=170843 RepID=UPI0031F73D2E